MTENRKPKAGSSPPRKIRYAVVGLGYISQAAVLPAFAHAEENSELASALVQRGMADKGLQFARRKNADGSNFYFIANRSNKKMEEWITLQTKANGVSLYNPMTGASGVAEFRKNSEGFIEVYLPMNQDESYIVQTSARAIAGHSPEC